MVLDLTDITLWFAISITPFVFQRIWHFLVNRIIKLTRHLRQIVIV